MAYSASDHQHAKAVIDRNEMPPLPNTRSLSQYSILNNEHLMSAQSLYEAPPSDTSYDPFRASRDPVIKASRQYMNVTVHRGTSNGNRALRPPSMQQSHRSSGPLRVEALKRESRVGSRRSTSSTSSRRPSSHRLSATRPMGSRSSLGSSVWASSPPVGTVKPNTMHKRAVNFSHLRRSSTASALTVQTSRDGRSIDVSPDHRQSLKRKLNGTDTNLSILASSPATKPQTAVRGRKETTTELPARLRIRKPRDPNQIVDREARKVSAELEKFCQEAFFRSSVGSTNRSSTSTDKQPSLIDTPATSVTQTSPATVNKPSTVSNSAVSNRPLPPLPNVKETPKTFTARELAETRKRIAARFAESDIDNADYFKDVLAHLDSLLPSQANTGSRAVTAPLPISKTLDDPGYLPAISEEERFEDIKDGEPECDSILAWTGGRAVTEPVGLKAGTGKHDFEHDLNTIRLVDPSSPSPIAPLNIRKASGVSSATSSTAPAQASPKVETVLRHHRKRVGHNFTIFEDSDDDMRPSFPTIPAVVTTAPPEQVPKAKKRGWFRRITSGSEEPENEPSKLKKTKQKSPGRWQDLEDRIRANPLRPVGHKPHLSDVTTSDVSEFPMRLNGSDKLEPSSKEEDGVKKGLWRLFRKRGSDKRKDEKVDQTLRLGCKLSKDANPQLIVSTNSVIAPEDFSSSSLGQSYNVPSHSVQSTPLTPPNETQPTNWLAKFLHIKPASRILCFQVGRGRVRQELVRLLRDWKRFGVRDVTFDRVTNIVNFRIDKSNRKSPARPPDMIAAGTKSVSDLRIKPVSVVIELFVVLEHGRRAQLAIARFTQAKGAASSFRKTIDVLEDVLSAKGMLVEDDDRKAAMGEILTQ